MVWVLRPRGSSRSASRVEVANEIPSLRDVGDVRSARSVSVMASVITDDGGTTAGGRTVPERVLVRARWGSGPDQLGRDRPSEANPEAPMSFTVDGAGNVLVLDQVNGRLVRFGRDGGVVGTVRLPLRAPQDIAVARDGTLVVLDRLGDAAVAIVEPDGRVRATLPLVGNGLSEGAQATAVIVDGENIYVEREHGPLVRVGDTHGHVDEQRSEVPGRPTRDGRSYISAALIEAPAGRFYVNAVDRTTGEHRFTREIRVDLSLWGIVLLDTDRAGMIYVAVLGERPGSAPSVPAVRLLCLDPMDGRPIGQANLPANTDPDETFREMTVLDEGGVVYALRNEEGVNFQRFDCM